VIAWKDTQPMSRIFVVGSLNADLVLRAERLPEPGETLTGSDLEVFPGGKGANQAYAAARLGAQVFMAGRVGADAYGEMLREGLAAAGADCSFVEVSARPTGIAGITVLPTGENAILLSPGANHDVTPQWVEEKLATLTRHDFVLCQLEIPQEATIAALRLARDRGACSMLDPTPARELPGDVLELAGIVTPNQSEMAILLGEDAAASHDQGIDAGRKLRAMGARNVALKMGELGCVWVGETETVTADGFSVTPVDTTAAGDTFNAALAVMLLGGASLTQALTFANAAAAISITRAGAQSSIPSRKEVEEFLNQVGQELKEEVRR
jgi:ribokinase